MNELQGKTVLVTGATGLIGSHLVERLLDENAKVVAIGRSEEKLRTVFKDSLCNNNFHYVVGNIAKKIPDEIKSADLIFHAASPISGQEIRNMPVDVIEANLMGIQNCLEYLRWQKSEKGVSGRLIVFSSVTVYGNNSEDDIKIDETDTCIAEALEADTAVYSESKRMMEVISRAYFKQYDVDSVIVRISYVYGFAEHQPNTAFYEFINKAIRGEDIVLNNSGIARRDNIYITDVVDALILLATKGKAGEAYNISSFGEKGNFKAIDEIAEIISSSVNAKTGKNVQVIRPQCADKRNPSVLVDNQKLKSLGWRLKVDINEGVMQTVQRYLEIQNMDKSRN
jgi:nucleoside-diphosphate-sugar epimerase